MKRLFLTTVMVGAFVYGNIVYGQGNLANARIQGRVLDETGAAVPGADLELVELNKGTKVTSQSDNAGFYHFEVPFGSYSLTAKMKDFGDTVVSPLNVTAKEVANIDLTMKPGTVVQTIDVSAAAMRLESATSDVGQDVVKEMVISQPIAHRNVTELVGLLPGVLQNRTTGGSTMNTLSATATWGRSNFTVGGGMRNTSSFLIDGVDATHSFGPGGGGSMVFIGPDSVQEFRLHLYDYPADLPRGSGVLSIVTKSGTNALHGAAYYFHQNSALNATDFFTNKNGQPKPPLVRHEFGGHIGGPVVIPKLYNGRNKTFFFFDYDQIRQPLAQNFQLRVPTGAELGGDFSGVYATNGSPIILYNPFDTFVDPATGRTLRRPFANNRIPAGLINQFAKNLTSYYPQANVPGGLRTAGGLPTNVNNFFSNASAPFRIDNQNLRIDHNVGENLRFTFQRIFNPPPVSCPNPYGTVAAPVTCNTEKPIFISGSMSWNITDHVILSWSGNWMDAKKTFDNFSLSLNQPFDMSSLGGPYAKGTPFSNLLLSKFPFESFPSFSIGGYGGLGAGSVGGVEATGGGQANLSWSKGRHNMKYGFQFYNRPVVFAYPTSTAGGFTATNLATTGQFTNGPDPLLPDVNTGNALADLELGILGGGVVNLPSLEQTYRDTYYAWYAQDDWKVSSKLTLNLGLRYDIALSFREAHNNTAVFNPNLPNPIGNDIGPNTGGKTLNQFMGQELKGGYVFAKSPLIDGRNRPASTDYKNISPRIGFAYAPGSKWVIRGGFAKIFFHGINGVTDNGNCPSCTGVTPVIPTIDGIHPNPAVTLNNPFPTGFNSATGSSLGLLTGVGLPLTETGAAFPVTPYALQYSGGFQRELPFNSRLSMMFVATRGRNLACPNDLCNDQLPLSLVQQYGNRLNDTVPNPFYGIITSPSSILSQPTVQQWRLLMNWPQFPGGSMHIPAVQNMRGFPLFTQENPFKSSWNAMLLSYEKRFSEGLHIQVAYTWSKTISNVDSFENWMAPTPSYQNIYEVEKEKSLSSEDVPQRLVLSHVYQLPVGKGKRYAASAPTVVDMIIGGWELGGNLTLASGTPLFFSVTPNNSNTHMANGNLRPNLVRTPTATEGDRGQKIQQWFDTSAFAAPAPFTYGDAPRTIGNTRSDGIKMYDLSLMKWFPLHGEAFKMQLRMDAFNLFNRTQFGFPNTTLGSPTFGVVSSVANPPRFIQVGFRFQW